jgi:AraC-like DNA-binding protein
MERLEYCRVPGMPGVEVLLAERSARLWRVYHETYAICSLLRLGGAVTRWTYRGKLHASHAEGLMLMEPGEVHVNPRHANPLPVRPADFRALFISPALLECAAADLGVDAQPHLKLAHSADPLLFHAFARFHASLERSASQLERESRLAHGIRLLLTHCTEKPAPAAKRPSRAVLVRARDALRQRYAQTVSLGELAALTGLSRYHLVRAFAREFGLTPHAYQIHVQAEKARHLLARGMSAAHVASEVGFADQSHFARHFKRIFHVTPGRYQLSARGGSSP